MFRQFTNIQIMHVLLLRYSDWLQAGWYGDRIPVSAKFSPTVHTGPGYHPATYTMDTGYFSGVKPPGSWRWPATPSRAEVKERVELYLYFPSGPSWPDLGRTLHFLSLFTTKWSETRGSHTNFWRHPHRIWAV